MEKLIESAVNEYISRVAGEPIIDSKIIGVIVQEFGFSGCRQLQSAVEDRIYEMKTKSLGK